MDGDLDGDNFLLTLTPRAACDNDGRTHNPSPLRSQIPDPQNSYTITFPLQILLFASLRYIQPEATRICLCSQLPQPPQPPQPPA